MTFTNNNEDISLSIALSKEQQYAMVGFAMTNPEFFIKCEEHIKPQWISDVILSQIYDQLLRFKAEYKILPRSDVELLSEPFFIGRPQAEKAQYEQALQLAKYYTERFNLDNLRKTLTKFARIQHSRAHAKYLVVQMNRHNYEDGVKAAEAIVRGWREIDFTPEQFIDFSDAVDLWLKEDVNESALMSTGSLQLDELLNGGLERGGNLAVLAPTFTGKSRFLITLARHLIVQDRKVLYLLHEDNPLKVKNRIIASMVGLGVKEIEAIMKSDIKGLNPSDVRFLKPNLLPNELQEVRELLIQELTIAKEILNKNLIFLSWRKAGKMYIEDIIDKVRQLQIEQKNKDGRGIDVIISDYPALLGSRQRFENDRMKLAYVYQCMNDLGAELNAFVAYAVQVNRHAAKEMKEDKLKHALTLETISESYMIAQNASSAISLNRSFRDASFNLLRIAVIKARDAAKQGMLIVRSNYNAVNLYGDLMMYQKVGRFIPRGCKTAFHNHFNMEPADVVDKDVKEAEVNLSALDREWLFNKYPKILHNLYRIDELINGQLSWDVLYKPEQVNKNNNNNNNDKTLTELGLGGHIGGG